MRIEIQDLRFGYESEGFRLDIPSLTIESGAHSAFVGPSGSGKTTLLRLIGGIVPSQQGRIQVGDADVSQLSDAARRCFRIRNIGFVFQDFELIEYLSVGENIVFPFRINPALRLTTQDRQRAEMLAKSMGVDWCHERYPHQLSQGERQRVAICRALLPGPGLLLADEPTGNLDPNNKARILKFLLEHCWQQGATLVMVTHDHTQLSDFDQVVDFQSFYVPPQAV